MAMPALISFGSLIFVAAAIQALAEALKVNHSVEVINMEDNDIGTVGAKAWPILVSNCFHAVQCLCHVFGER